jgi:hypothetical protein
MNPPHSVIGPGINRKGDAMRSLLSFVAVAALLLSCLNLASGADEVLVPGDPPLMQKTIDLYQEMWQWYCDIQLTPEQQREVQHRYISFWKKRATASNQQLLADYERMEKNWQEALKLDQAEQNRKRAEVREPWLSTLRGLKDDLSPFLVSLYDATYKPGGTKNPILVAGDPPLTQSLIDLDTATEELLLDLRLTDEQRREYQRLFIDDWKGWDQNERRRQAKIIESWSGLPTWSSYQRNMQRTLDQPRALAARAKGLGKTNRWLLELHASMSKPGSARNPVLVAGEPPLTQLAVDRYTDYVEVMIDLSLSGGFTTPQRQVLQDYLVKDWKKMSTDDRQELLGDVKRWEDAAAEGTAQANKCLNALRPKVVAQLRTARDDPRSVWLLEVFDEARALYQRRLAELKRQYSKAQAAIDAMPDGRDHSPGRWVYNPGSGKYDRWVPNR